MLKLNLGAGDIPVEGYTSIDRKHGQEVYPLKYEPESVDVIRASHILEHFSHREVFSVLCDWVRTLKIGGVIQLAVPDFRIISQAYLNGKQLNVPGYLMGGHIDENDYHKSIFDEGVLRDLMSKVGLTDIQPWQSTISDAAALPISLNLQGTKTANSSPMKPVCNKIHGVAAVMSTPRVGFTDNHMSAMRALAPLGIPLGKASGVFWDACLTRIIEQALENGASMILTIDYDTWFTRNQVVALAQLMRDNPEVDALVPLQIGREKELPMLGLRSPDGQIVTEVSSGLFENPLTRIWSGHFGLTMIRAEVFEKLEKPWFQSVPDAQGRWGKGRQDADIYFWNNFMRVGCKAYSANKISLGHMQLFCTFPGKPEDHFKPIHMYMGELEKNGPPAHCEPQIIGV